MQSRAILFTAPSQVEVRDIHLPQPGPGEALVETAFSVVSSGTELRCLAGKQTGAVFPFIPGYSLAGTVIAVGEGTTIPPGTRVFCTGTAHANVSRTWGGHVAHAVKREEQLFPLPEGVELPDAAITHLAAIAYHGLRLNKPQPHEQIAVIGLGAIGQLAARLHAMTGAHTVAADLSPQRVALAREAGLEAFVPRDLAEFRAYFPQGADSVVDATGVPALVAEGIAVARDLGWDDAPTPGARYVIQGSYAADFSIPYDAAFRKELTFLFPRDCQPRDFRAVLNLLRRGLLRVRDLIGETVEPEDAPRIYAALQARDSRLITAAFRWR